MANHIKAGMLIEKKVHVVHIETINSISTMEKTCMLYILKLICLLQKHGKKRMNMFITETRKKKNMLYTLKLVCLLLKYKKKRCVANTKTSMFTTEISKIQV